MNFVWPPLNNTLILSLIVLCTSCLGMDKRVYYVFNSNSKLSECRQRRIPGREVLESITKDSTYDCYSFDYYKTIALLSTEDLREYCKKRHEEDRLNKEKKSQDILSEKEERVRAALLQREETNQLKKDVSVIKSKLKGMGTFKLSFKDIAVGSMIGASISFLVFGVHWNEVGTSFMWKTVGGVCGLYTVFGLANRIYSYIHQEKAVNQ